jgi:hypothetical protein
MMVSAFSKDGAYVSSFAKALEPCEGFLFHGVEDASGRIVLVGYFGAASTSTVEENALAVIRLRADGTIDTTFGSPTMPDATCTAHPGVAGKDFVGLHYLRGERVLLDGAGRILVAGRASDTPYTKRSWFVARFRP